MSLDNINPLHYNGWDGSDVARDFCMRTGPREFCMNTPGLSYAGKRMMLYELVRDKRVYGQDTPNYPQVNGSCVSFGAKNAVEHSQAADMLIRNDGELFKLIFPPYLYGCGRVLVAGYRRKGDGSYGGAQATAVQKYGAVPTDTPNLPKYSGDIEWQWSGPPGPPDEFLQVGKQHLVKTIAKINSWSDAVEAVCNGCAVTIASNQGFEMTPRSDGFHYPHSRWNHQMCLIGVSDGATQGSHGIILNSWGDQMGKLVDFDTKVPLPIGCLRVHAETIDSMIKQDDSWAYSVWDGFPDVNKQITRAMFDLI